MHLTLFVWRQAGPDAPGAMRRYDTDDVSPDMSFLEMLDVVNESLVGKGEQPIAFDHDCREGICGSCGMMINGVAHGPMKGTATCQLHMRSFADGATIYVEPWRSRAFPVIKDLVVNRGAFDRIIAAGGFVTAATGGAQDANDISRPEARRRRGDGRRGVHRMRSLRRGVPKRVGLPVHGGENIASWPSPAGPTGATAARAPHGGADGRRRLRALHALWRMSGSVPEGDQHRHDRADEPRLHDRHDFAPPPRRARAGRHRMTVTTSPIPSVREWPQSAREERRS